VRVCAGTSELAATVEALLGDPQRRAALGQIGRRRMGEPGGSSRIAAAIDQLLLRAPGEDG